MGGLRPSARPTSQLIEELTHIYAYHCPQCMRPKFQTYILINKKVGPSAPRKGHFTALEGGGSLTHTYVYHCIPFYVNSIHTKFQASILINKKVFKRGGLRPHARVTSRPWGGEGEGESNPHICVPLYSILNEQYTCQISSFYLDK